MNRITLADLARAERETYVRERLRGAVDALKRSPLPQRFLTRLENGEACIRSLWPEINREPDEVWFAEWSGMLPGTRTRTPPTSAQIDAMMAVLPWFYRIDDQRYRAAVFLRAWPMGWRRVGSKLGVSHMTAKSWERAGIEIVLRQPVVASWWEDALGA